LECFSVIIKGSAAVRNSLNDNVVLHD